MKTAAVICEFNPFHNGHKFMLDKIKAEHADRVICIMSGSFVQRGDAAVCDKYSRTKAALENGCDIVVELPTVFAVSNAREFARGGVETARAMGADMLCFGVNNTDTTTLREISSAFDDKVFNDKVSEIMKSGEYYPKAVSTAIAEVLSKSHSNALNDANNILAVEYMKALKGTNIEPIAINRIGVSHDSDTPHGNIASASYIRELLKQNKEYSDYTDMIIDEPVFIEKIEAASMYKLKTMTLSEIENLPDVAEGLHNRIYDCVRKYNSLDELLSALKTKRYIMSRLRRIVICAVLGITKQDVKMSAQYIRVLGMNESGAKILANGCTLPIIGKVKTDVSKINDDAKHMFDIDVRASEIYSLICGKGTNDYAAKMISSR